MSEIYAGGGYLSQDSSTIYFGLPQGRRVQSIDVRWANGRTTHHEIAGDEQLIELNEGSSD
jgi:hypothetical protein